MWGAYVWRHPASQSYWANVTPRIDHLKCSTLSNLMPFSFVVQIGKLNPYFWGAEMNLQEALGQDQILLITSYFCPGSDWNSIYGESRAPRWDKLYVTVMNGVCKERNRKSVLQTSLLTPSQFQCTCALSCCVSCRHNLKGKSVILWVVVCYHVPSGALKEHMLCCQSPLATAALLSVKFGPFSLSPSLV